MSSSGPQLAPSTVDTANSNIPAKERILLAQLLHALNQPLTGLQCSLELAVAGPRRPEQYVQVLTESLELTQRMRLLVEAIRELTDERGHRGECETFRLDTLLHETAEDLLPVAGMRGVRLIVEDDPPPTVYAERAQLAQLLFRVLDSALTLASENGELRLAARRERELAVVDISWSEAAPPEHSPFSKAELGLLVARAGFENAGAQCSVTRSGNRQGCQIRLPLARNTSTSSNI
jgi:signal transduction histidine kinase